MLSKIDDMILDENFDLAKEYIKKSIKLVEEHKEKEKLEEFATVIKTLAKKVLGEKPSSNPEKKLHPEVAGKVFRIKSKLKEINLELESMLRHPANDVHYRGKKEWLEFRKAELTKELSKLQAA